MIKDKLGILGITAVLVSPLVVPTIYTELNANTSYVQTSRGRTEVTEWNNFRGREITTGGIPACTIYADTNRDGTIDTKTHMFGAPRKGVFVNHPPITEQDRQFCAEAIANTKIPEKRSEWYQ